MDRPFGRPVLRRVQLVGNTKTWFAALRQAIGEKTEASFSYRRHSDLFVSIATGRRCSPIITPTKAIRVAVRRREDLADNVRLHMGSRLSRFHRQHNLGDHSRGRGAGYASLDIRALKRFSFSIGAREEIYRSVSASSARLSAAASGCRSD